ncbi:MAG: hypothetical protein VYA69_05965 [Gemmatimonadota bacterium]|nr:hypothetical protein [Gemmatimonadota bacterium]
MYTHEGCRQQAAQAFDTVDLITDEAFYRIYEDSQSGLLISGVERFPCRINEQHLLRKLTG